MIESLLIIISIICSFLAGRNLSRIVLKYENGEIYTLTDISVALLLACNKIYSNNKIEASTQDLLLMHRQMLREGKKFAKEVHKPQKA